MSYERITVVRNWYTSPMKYCGYCGEKVVYRIPDGDNRPRYVCDACSTVHYQNPRVITGCVVTWNQKILLCKRAIEPRKGKWTLPAGFLENGETIEQGAARETREEANVIVVPQGLYTIFNLPHISQIYVFYRAEITENNASAGEETEEVLMFSEDDIPWSELAFPVIGKTLELYFSDRQEITFQCTLKT